jgi:hypothetical protein
MDGYGVYTYRDGTQLKGQWSRNRFTGAATP